jgi:hypothetical protein
MREHQSTAITRSVGFLELSSRLIASPTLVTDVNFV